MEARAQAKHVRISPRKVKIVLDLIRNKPVDVALAIVAATPPRLPASRWKSCSSPRPPMRRTTSTWIRTSLYVAECFVCPGPILKRIRPRAQGRAFRIEKRTSHITLVLKEKE